MSSDRIGPIAADEFHALFPDLTLGNKLQHLLDLSADDVAGIELIVDDCLERRWRERHREMLVNWLRH